MGNAQRGKASSSSASTALNGKPSSSDVDSDKELPIKIFFVGDSGVLYSPLLKQLSNGSLRSVSLVIF